MKRKDAIDRIWVDVTLLLAALTSVSYVLGWSAAVNGVLTIAFLLTMSGFDPGTRAVERLTRLRSRRPPGVGADGRGRGGRRLSA